MSVYLYTTCSVLTVGCPVYTNDSLTTPAGNGQYYDGATCWTISGGIITGTGACTTTSTTTTTTTVFSCAQCKTWQYSSIPSGGDIVYYYSCINGTLQSIGLSDTDPNGTFCNCNSVGNPFTSVSPGGTTLTELGTCDPFATTTTSTTTTTTTAAPTTSTTTTTTTAASVFIDILGDASNQANGSGFITVYATACLAGSQENVNTNVAVDFTWTGDSSSTISGTVTIPAGASCGSGSFGGATIGENVSVFTFDILDPSASGNQIYQIATVATHGIPSCGC